MRADDGDENADVRRLKEVVDKFELSLSGREEEEAEEEDCLSR